MSAQLQDATIYTAYNYPDRMVVTRIQEPNKDKTFAQSYNGTGKSAGWVRQMYHADRFENAIRRGDWIIVHEGEKAAEACAQRIGYVSTTFLGGAKAKITTGELTQLTDAMVCILADADEVGLNAARRRAGLIAQYAREVRLIERLPNVPDKGDFYDWDGDRAAFTALIDAAQIIEASEEKIEETPRVVQGETKAPCSIATAWDALELPPFNDERGPCPIHKGDDDNFVVYRDSDGWACFSRCGSGGVLDLVQRVQGLANHAAAHAWLAARGLVEKRMDYARLAAGGCTDKQHGEFFAALYGDRVRYNVDNEKWLVYDGKRWNMRNGKITAQSLVKRSVDTMARHAVLLPHESELRKKLFNAAKVRSSVTALHNTLTMASSEEGIAVNQTAFDTDPWFLNCKNGTLDLRTGALRPHDPDDLISRLVNVDYDPSVRSTLWEQTVSDVFSGDAATIAFFQRAAGYWLTGLTREEVFFIFYGGGRNGKGTVMHPLILLLREYYEGIRMSALTQKKYAAENTPEIAKLAGSRLVVASEAKESDRFDAPLIKNITGGDMITAMFKYGNAFDFMPQCKLVVQVNHLPKVDSDDDAIWARVRALAFKRNFEEEGIANKNLKAQLAKELQGVLTWCVEGCLAWQREGLGTCADVEQSTKKYRDDNDPVAQWIESSCVVKPGAETSKDALEASYRSWCVVNGHRDTALTPQRLARKLTHLGFPLDSHQRKRVGLALIVTAGGDSAAF